MKKLDPQAAVKLKTELRQTAMGEYGHKQIDLSDPANAYTAWIKNGSQGYGYVGSGTNPAEIGRVVGVHMVHDPVILEVSKDQDTVIVVECAMG